MSWLITTMCSLPLKFMHITKTGGTSIEEAGLRLNVTWGMHHTEHEERYGFWHNLPTRKDPSLLRQYEWFTVVRNPYDRIVSEFWCKWGGDGRPKSVNVQNFNEFIMKMIRTRGMNPSGDHYTPQFRYLSLLNIGPDIVLRVLHFERLHSDFAHLLKIYNLPQVKIPFKNSAGVDKFNVSHLSTAAISLIQQVYKSDFETFGYNMDVKEALMR